MGEPAADRKIDRIKIGISFSDGTEMTWAADNPVRPEFEVTGPALKVSAGNPLVPLRIEPPGVNHIRVEFNAHPAHPVATEHSLRPAPGVPVTTIARQELDQLLAVATLYVNAFGEDETMTLPEKLALQDVEAVLERHGPRF